ncbi:MAG: hypothetical protein KKB38_20560, partial [Gammaproteobacteria bacterium]|nr:hypothetical protein [Gammaproteobacteria bacterium]
MANRKYNPDQVVAQAVAAASRGTNLTDIAQELDMPRTTLRDILSGRDLDYTALAAMAAEEADEDVRLLQEQVKHWKRLSGRY